MSDKNDEPFGCAFFLIIIIAFIITQIIIMKKDIDSVDGYQLSKLVIGIVGGLYGIIYYLIKNRNK